MIWSLIGFGIMFITAFANKMNKDTIKDSMWMKRLVICGIFGGLFMGMSGVIIMLTGG